MLKIGCHLSSAGGFTAMGKTAVSIGANVFQFFTRNPRGGAAKAIDPADVEAYHALAREAGLSTILAHAPYTINCCAAKEDTRRFALETMADDMKRMEYVPGNLYNFHPGSHVGQGMDRGVEMIAEVLNQILTPEQHTTVLLETMAGKGTEVGSRFEELAAILDKVELSDKMGVCLDTCHVYDAGYDIVNDLDGVLEAFDRIIGLDRLRAIHVNDSKNPFTRTGTKRSVRAPLASTPLSGSSTTRSCGICPFTWRPPTSCPAMPRRSKCSKPCTGNDLLLPRPDGRGSSFPYLFSGFLRTGGLPPAPGYPL